MFAFNLIAIAWPKNITKFYTLNNIQQQGSGIPSYCANSLKKSLPFGRFFLIKHFRPHFDIFCNFLLQHLVTLFVGSTLLVDTFCPSRICYAPSKSINLCKRVISVTRFTKVLPLWQNLKRFWQLFKVYVVIGKI